MPRMAFSQAYKILWYTGIVFVILPHFNLGLLSDYKICGDTECESLMSRVQATKDHHGKDCRFLNFKRGDTIFVYHKLTGKRDDLWAGTIGRQFGYFPKDAVQEEQVYASTEKVVETQKSDFICMDEFGYPIDSSHLDSDDDSDDDQQIQNQHAESLELTVDTSTESPSAGSADPSTQSLVSAQQPDSTPAGEDENKSAGDDAARTHKEAHETPAAISEQGGSPSSSWLGSSVTGWLGLGKEGQPGNLAEGEKNDENRETQAEASLSSSVTGWLGFGGERKPEYAVNNREEEEKTAPSLTSTMTGWLGLVDTKTDFTKKEQDEERGMDDESEPKETFRSRRMSLDLEGSQLHEEEKKEMGTLDWLGNGLSSTLGFGGSNQEPETIEEEKENPVSNSWLDMGVGDILGFRKNKNENDESTGSGFEETDKDKTLKQATALGNVDMSQSPPAETEQEKTEPGLQTLEEKIGTEAIPDVEDNSISSSSNKDTYQSNVEKHDQFPQSETLVTEENFINNNIDASDGSKDSVLPVGPAAGVDQKDVSPQTILEQSSPTVDVLSSRTDEERSAETVSEEQQIAVNKGADNDRESGEEEIKTAGNNDRDFLTHSVSGFESNLYSTYSNSMGQSVANNEEGNKDQLQSKATESLEQAVAKIISQANNPKESTIASFEIGVSNDGHENERSNTETDVHLMEISTTQTDASAEQSQVSGNAEESSGKSQSSLSSDIAQEENEPSHSKEDSVTEADILDTVAMNHDNNTDVKTHQGELVQIAEVHPVESSSQELESSPSSNRSTQSLYENVPEEETLSQDTKVDNTDHNSASLETETEEVEESKEEIQEVEEIKEGERQQKTEEGKKEVDEIKEDKENEDKDKLKKNGNKEEVKKELKLEEMEELKMEVKHEQVDKLKREERQEEVHEMEKQKEVKEGERQVGVDKVKTEEKKQEVEEIKEEDKHDEVERLSDVEEVKEEKKQEMTKELEQEKQVELEEKQEEEVGELKEEEKQNELKDIEVLKERVKEEGEEKQIQSPHLKVQNKNTHDVGKPGSESYDKDTHSENAKTEWAEEEKREEEMTKLEKVEEVKEEKKEVDEMQQVNNVEGVREKEENVQKCSNQLCLKTTEDESVRDRNENISEGGPSSADESTVQTGRQNDQMLADRAGESVEKDRLQEEVKEKTPNDATADKVEKNNSTPNSTGTEDIHSNNPNSVSDNGALEAEQIGPTKYSENELEPPGEKFIDKILSEHKIESLSSTSDSEEETHPQAFQNPTGSSLPPGEHNRGSGEKESTGAFGLFQNAFSYLSETAVTESKNATESAPSLDTNTVEMSQPQASLTLKQEPDSTTDSSQVSVQDLNKNSPIAIPTQQPKQLPPPSTEIHSQFYTPSPHAGTPLQTKTLSKHYKSLLSHVSVDEVTILTELFGRHKMQFLDYILGSSETVTNDPDNDESILSDIERLLDYHRETLVAPNMRLADAPQEDKEKTRTLVALQKLEILLGRLRDEFSTGKSDVNKANLQAEASCVGATCWTYSKEKEESRKTEDSSISHDIKRDKAMEKDSRYLGGVIGKGRKTEDERRGKKGTEEENESHRHFEPGSPQPLEGAMKPILDFVRQIAEHSSAHAHTVRELIWIAVQPG